MTEDHPPRSVSRRCFLERALSAGAALVLPLAAACRVGRPVTGSADQAVRQVPAPAEATAGPAVRAVEDQPAAHVLIWPGPFAQVLREVVQPSFEAEHGVRLVIEEGLPAHHLERLRAEQSQPRAVLASLDENAVPVARREGLIRRLSVREIPNLAAIEPAALLDNGFGVSLGLSWVTAWYNSARIKHPVTSYAAFWDPSFRGHVAVPAIGTAAGIQWLVVAAALAGGRSLAEAQYDVEPGFEQWRRLKPNLHSTFETFSSVAPLLAQGEVWLAFGDSRQACRYILKGAPVQRAQVAEGAFLGSHVVTLVQHPRLERLGNDLINRLLSPEVQSALVAAANVGPVNRQVAVDPALADLVPSSPQDLRAAVQLDWSNVDQNLASWLDRWQQDVAG